MSAIQEFGKVKITDTGTDYTITLNGNIRMIIGYDGVVTFGAVSGTPAGDIGALIVRADGSLQIGAPAESRTETFYAKNAQSQELRFTSDAGLEMAGVKSYIKFPSMTAAQRDALTEAAGMVIFNTDTTKLQVCTAASTWVDLH